MAENGGISQKQIDRTYIYFDKQTPEEKRKILDKFIEQRKRGGQAGIEFKDIDNKTLKELCKQYSSDLYSGSDEARELEMVKDIYRALNEKFGEERREGNTRSYANLAGSRGTGGEGGSGAAGGAEGGAAGGTQGGKRRNRNKTKKRRNKNKNKKSRRS
jgi:hypothetical protein